MTIDHLRWVELDDFPISPTGATSAQSYFEAYSRSKELLQQIEKKQPGTATENALLTLFKEVQREANGNAALYRKHIDAQDAFATLWISQARSLASIFVELNDVPKFTGLTTADLAAIAKHNADVDSIRLLPGILASHGIVLIYEPYLAGMKLDGAVFTLERGTPVVALSLRFPRLDSLWFTLMHELAHITLHYDQLSNPILDDLEIEPTDLIEKAADRLALNTTISRSDWRNCEALYERSAESVYSFAKRIGVHPAIVAGRLRRELNRYDFFSDIVNEVDVRKVIWG